jgi:hypothetical protein
MPDEADTIRRAQTPIQACNEPTSSLLTLWG